MGTDARGVRLGLADVVDLLTFLALGYVRPFPRVEDTPLLIVGVVWGLLLTGFFGIHTYLSASATYGWLAVTTAIAAMRTFFARHKLRLTLLVLSPIVSFSTQFGAPAPPTRGFLPLIFALIGWGIGSVAHAIVKQPPAPP